MEVRGVLSSVEVRGGFVHVEVWGVLSSVEVRGRFCLPWR